MDADFRVGIDKTGIFRGDEKIAVQGDFESPGDGVSVDCPDDRFRAGGDNIGKVGAVTPRVEEIVRADNIQIDAGTERFARARDNGDFDVAVVRHVIEIIIEIDEQVLADGVVPCGTVQGDQCYVVLYIEEYGFFHGGPPCFFPVRMNRLLI